MTTAASASLYQLPVKPSASFARENTVSVLTRDMVEAVSYTHLDRFVRTTDDYHIETCQKIFTKLYEQGDIYKGEYTGHYCKPCESFWTCLLYTSRCV